MGEDLRDGELQNIGHVWGIAQSVPLWCYPEKRDCKRMGFRLKIMLLNIELVPVTGTFKFICFLETEKYFS